MSNAKVDAIVGFGCQASSAFDGGPIPRLRRGRVAAYSLDQLAELPEPTWLIEDFVQERSVVLLYGASGSGKTFVAIDAACCLASDRDWHGLATARGKEVMYVFTEGFAETAYRRIAAWESRYGRVPADRFYCTEADLQFREPDSVSDLIDTVMMRDGRVGLIVVDTFAKASVGLDENKALDAGIALDQAQRLAEATGAAVCLVHHTGHDASRERGSSAFMAGVNTKIKVAKHGHQIEVKTEKQKAAACAAPLWLGLAHERGCLVVVDGDEPCDEEGDGDERVARPRSRRAKSRPSPERDKVLAILREEPTGLAPREWRKRSMAAGVERSTYYWAQDKLTTLELVEKVGGKWVAV